MFELSEIRRLLDAFESSDWDEVHLVADGVEVHISTSAQSVTPVAAAPAPVVAAAPAPVETAAPEPAAAAPATADVNGAHPIKSPSPGIFWRSPAPGEPPFVDVGQQVRPDTPIGIVEVMKLMNQVLAGVEGTVRAIVVSNGARVDRDQPMVYVDLA